jgi:hypothetical protein
MAIITLEVPTLSPEAKKRLGDRILHALQLEGVPPATTVLMFRPVADDLYIDGLLVEAEPERPAPSAPLFSLTASAMPPIQAPIVPASMSALSKGKPGRKVKTSIEASRDLLKSLLMERRSINSFEAQKAFEKADMECTPALLRKLFNEMEEEGIVLRTGMKRGTRYIQKGPDQDKTAASIKLVKAESSDD